MSERKKGRPLADGAARTEIVKARVTPEEKARITAKRGNIPEADWLRAAIRKALR